MKKLHPKYRKFLQGQADKMGITLEELLARRDPKKADLKTPGWFKSRIQRRG